MTDSSDSDSDSDSEFFALKTPAQKTPDESSDSEFFALKTPAQKTPDESSEEEDEIFQEVGETEMDTIYLHVRLGILWHRVTNIFHYLLKEFRRKKGRGPGARRRYLSYEKYCYAKNLLRGHSLFWFEHVFASAKEELESLMFSSLQARTLELVDMKKIYQPGEKDLSREFGQWDREEWKLEESGYVVSEDLETLERFSLLFERWADEVSAALGSSSPLARLLERAGREEPEAPVYLSFVSASSPE